MKKHIDAEQLESVVARLNSGVLFEFPAADVQEVKHGRWVRTHNPIGQEITVCSVCGKIMRQAYPFYCGNCGAKMDGEQNE